MAKITTNETNLSNRITKEINQIGFYQNEKNEIQAVIMPKSIEKVPNQLPPKITSLKTCLLLQKYLIKIYQVELR
ncbi:hypothetical protein [Spiroplasma endosymbiont of Polydrusus pterygomalis]|uniref:hypothetical protein n=1 Tax=Spiroplasma endosymbiont of Polydrusus pterygomalis TaxID=3139327 RepID=UPI003CCAA819